MSAAYEIENQIIQDTRNKKHLGPFVFNPEDVAYVASLYWKDVPFDNQTQYGREFMPAGEHHPRDIVKDPKKFPPVFMKIEGAFLPVDKGDDEREPKYQPAIERAKDIARRYAQFGVFVPADGKNVTSEECAAALKMLEATYRQRVEWSDEEWRRTGSVKMTISNAPIALKYFGLERDWADRAGDQDTCPYCSRAVKAKAVKCGNDNCGAILDWARAYQGGIVTKEQAIEHGVSLPGTTGRKRDVEL